MKENHINQLLEEHTLGELSDGDLETIRLHTARCAECRRAYEASLASSRLLRDRASIVVEPPPFFRTRVMAAIREKRLEPELFGLLRMWLAARSLVASMAMVVMVLGALAFFTGGEQTRTDDLGDNSSQWIVYERDSLADDEMTYSQVLADIYDPEIEPDTEK